MTNSLTVERASASGRGPGRIWLYDRSGNDQPLDDQGPLPELGEDQTLWADLDYDSLADHESLMRELGVADLVESLDRDAAPYLAYGRGLFHLTIKAVVAEGPESKTLHAFVGQNWIVTIHDGELDLAGRFNEPLVGETRIGDLDGPKFLSLILDWQLNGYFKALTRLHGDIDALDEKLLQISPDEETLIERLLELRKVVRRLRELLTSHREPLGLLSHPESDAVFGYEAADDFQRIETRLQQALDEVSTGREMIIGSFDIFMTRTAQATNDVMRRLTIVSVLLLPAVVIAGIMGMNFKVGFFEATWLFWVVVGSMVILGGVTLVVARRRGWY